MEDEDRSLTARNVARVQISRSKSVGANGEKQIQGTLSGIEIYGHCIGLVFVVWAWSLSSSPSPPPSFLFLGVALQRIVEDLFENPKIYINVSLNNNKRCLDMATRHHTTSKGGWLGYRSLYRGLHALYAVFEDRSDPSGANARSILLTRFDAEVERGIQIIK